MRLKKEKNKNCCDFCTEAMAAEELWIQNPPQLGTYSGHLQARSLTCYLRKSMAKTLETFKSALRAHVR